MSTHRREMQHIPRLLTRILLGDRESVCDSAKKLTEQDHWFPTVILASRWRVVPQLRRRVDVFHLDMDSKSKNHLSSLSLAAVVQSMLVANSCSKVLQHLDDHTVPALAIKGVGMIGNLYGHPSERMVNDVDLLVCDLEKARMALNRIGMSPDLRLSHPERHCLCLVNKEGVQIDLHTDPFFNDILSRAETVGMLNTSVRVANPVDSMTQTVSHVLRSNFAPFSTVKDLCDLAMWWTVQFKRWKIDDVIEEMRLHGLLEPCSALWQILTQLDSRTSARNGISRVRDSFSARQLQNATHLMELFNFQLQDRFLHAHFITALAKPSSMIRYLASRTRNEEDTGRISPLSREFLTIVSTEALQLAREITNLNSRSLRYLSALLRAYATYDSSDSSRQAAVEPS